MAQTSIHFQPVKGGSEEHNKRLKQLDYVRSELSNNNDYWQSDTQSARLAFIADNAKAKTGRKMQAKATPIREAVVVIDDNTTMADLHNLAKRLRDRFGLDVFQIAIHRDEGHVKSKDKIKLNLHAHLVADWTDHETGKSLKLSRQDMSDMQTICAEVLHMERGRTSDKMHLSAIQYKIAAETKRAAEAEKEAREAEAKAIGSLVVGGANKLANALGFGKEAKALKDVPRQLAIAKEDGKAEAIAEVLKTAKLTFSGKTVTPEMVGKALAKSYQDCKQLQNSITHMNQKHEHQEAALRSENAFTLQLPIIDKAINALKDFVFHVCGDFSAEDKEIISQVLQGDERAAKWLRVIAESNSGMLSQGQYWSRWNQAERAMTKIANGEHQEQQEQQGRGWHL